MSHDLTPTGIEIYPEPEWQRVTVEQLQERGLWHLTPAEKVAARTAIALERMEARTKHPLTTAFLNKRS